MAAVFESTAPAHPAGDMADEVWARIARSYAAFRSPFVPCGEDIAAYERAVARQADLRGTKGLQALMLGVTPGLALMNWPPGTRLRAVEISPAVIDALWPGDIPRTRKAMCASWLAVPMERGSCDVVIGDGSLSTCRFPGEVRNLAQAVWNLLVDDGLFAFRSYVRQHQQESVGAVFDALFSVGGLSVDSFKMRLYLAMQRSAQEGVAVRDAARILDQYNLNPRTMQERLGWCRAAVEPFAAWPESDAVYSFPTLEELRAVIGEVFDEISLTFPAYELGHCCPMVVVRRKPARK